MSRNSVYGIFFQDKVGHASDRIDLFLFFPFPLTKRTLYLLDIKICMTD